MVNIPELYEQQLAVINNNSQITNDIINQIKKDFGNLLKGDPIINSNAIYEGIFNWIAPIITDLAKNDRKRLTALIYTIDAGFIHKRIAKKDLNEIEHWTHAIIIRECLKIFIRMSYKG